MSKELDRLRSIAMSPDLDAEGLREIKNASDQSRGKMAEAVAEGRAPEWILEDFDKLQNMYHGALNEQINNKEIQA